MMLMQVDESQLVLVDFQARLKPVMLDADAVWANAARLATLAKALQVPIWGTEQNPSRLGEMPADLRSHCHQVLARMHFSAVEEGLLEWLCPPAKPVVGNARSLPKHLQKNQAPVVERQHVVLAGCEAHICLLQTALDLLEEDKPIAGQKFVCVSFVSPEKILKQKEEAIEYLKKLKK
jgi:nicotinamidase-related amidase